MRPPLTVESLERRDTPSTFAAGSDVSLTASVTTLDASVAIHSLTLPAGKELDLSPGVHLTVADGSSTLGGLLRYGDASAYVAFRGGTLAINGGNYGATPNVADPGNFYLDGGCQATLANAVFGANLYTGVEPLSSVIDPGTVTTVAGPVAFQGYVGYLNFGTTLLTAPQTFVGSGTLVNEYGTVRVTAPQAEVAMSILTGDQQGTTLVLDDGVSLTVTPSTHLAGGIPFAQAVYLAGPSSLQMGANASINASEVGVILLGSNSLPFAYFADAVTVAALTRGS